MITKHITLDTIKDIYAFVAEVNKCKGNVTAKKIPFVVDARSLLGMFSIDTSTGFDVEYPETETALDEWLQAYEE